jgi:hypothetical protein
VGPLVPPRLIGNPRCSRTLKVNLQKSRIERRCGQVLSFQCHVFNFSHKPGFVRPQRGFPRKMNASESIREHWLVMRMHHWLIRSRHFFDGCPKWRARKNFWSLVRKYRAIAERHGLREIDVF